MTNDKKTTRWIKNLHKAGLIGNTETLWKLSDNNDESLIVTLEEAAIDFNHNLTQTVDSNIEKLSAAYTNAEESYTNVNNNSSLNELRKAMKERSEMSDLTGTLEIAEMILKIEQGDTDASLTRLKCRQTLMQMYESKIGSLNRIPKRLITEEEIIWRNLDPVAGFIVSNIDGVLSFEDIIDVSSLSRFDTCRVLNQLIQDGIIE